MQFYIDRRKPWSVGKRLLLLQAFCFTLNNSLFNFYLKNEDSSRIAYVQVTHMCYVSRDGSSSNNNVLY